MFCVYVPPRGNDIALFVTLLVFIALHASETQIILAVALLFSYFLITDKLPHNFSHFVWD